MIYPRSHKNSAAGISREGISFQDAGGLLFQTSKQHAETVISYQLSFQFKKGTQKYTVNRSFYYLHALFMYACYIHSLPQVPDPIVPSACPIWTIWPSRPQRFYCYYKEAKHPSNFFLVYSLNIFMKATLLHQCYFKPS